MIFLYSDVLYKAGGIETYLHALALHLQKENIPSRVAIAELEPCPLVDELISKGIEVYRQRRLPGDRWLVRQRCLQLWLQTQLKPGDWVFCVRQPMPELYLGLVRSIHRQQARLAASWMFAPEFLPPTNKTFCQAVAETDAVISVSQCTVGQFKSVYGYQGKVHVVPYHNLPFFEQVVPLAPGPPWKIGYLGRLESKQKNLVELIKAFSKLAVQRSDVELHLHGRGPDEAVLRQIVAEDKLCNKVIFHGAYDHRRDLPGIMERCHLFVHPSRFEGGPCFSLLELIQAGRYCVASKVGGIPDLYQNRPDIGALVEPGDVRGLTEALDDSIAKISSGPIRGQVIRDRYLQAFDIASAHNAWLRALDLAKQAVT
jgi:glycosyltransferase involved in cell wall biosynthesis